MLHSSYKYTNGIHYPYSYEYTTVTAMNSATGFVSTDLYKLAVITSGADIGQVYQLTATTPTWVQIDASKLPTDLAIASQASGDILYFNGTNWIRLAKGTDAQVLTLASGVPSWATASGGSSAKAISLRLGGNAYVGENIIKFRVPYAMTLAKVRLGTGSAPTGSNLIGDVNYHATDPTAMTTIFTTQGNRPEISASAFTDDSGTPDVTSLGAGGWIGISIDQIGSTLPGTEIIFELLE